jgi:hypothetical protein
MTDARSMQGLWRGKREEEEGKAKVFCVIAPQVFSPHRRKQIQRTF